MLTGQALDTFRLQMKDDATRVQINRMRACPNCYSLARLLDMVVSTKSVKRAAYRLGISDATVYSRLVKARQQLGTASNRETLAAWAKK